MDSRRKRIFGWLLFLINSGYCVLGLLTGSMDGLGDLFGWFSERPLLPTTLEEKPIAYLLGLSAHAVFAVYGLSLIWRASHS